MQTLAPNRINPVEHLGLVGKVVRSYLDRGVEREDLVSEGAIGLLRAAATFQPELGFQFSTYAVRCVKTRLNRVIECHDLRRCLLPAHGDDLDDDFLIRNATRREARPSGPDPELLDKTLRALALIPAREADVIRRYYGVQGHTARSFDAIGREMDVSKVRVRQIHKMGIWRLRKLLGSKRLAIRQVLWAGEGDR